MIDKALTIDGWMTETELAFLYSMASAVPDQAKVVEVGSWKGRSTNAICSALAKKQGAELFAVDTWEGDSQICADYDVKDALEQDLIYKEFCENMAGYDFLKVVRADSVKAAEQFEDNSIDWIFIDGDHSYDAVCNDVKAWFPKIKDGGVIAGHDHPKFAVTLATRTLFDHVCVWDSIWFVTKGPTTLKQNLIPAAEVKARRVLLKQSF